MREPRFRFPNEVRSATRVAASRMVRSGDIARSPAELEAWIAEEPDVQEPLESGGYGSKFSASDLFPLLQAMLENAGVPAHEPQRVERSAQVRWVVGFILLIVIVAVVTLLVTGSS